LSPEARREWRRLLDSLPPGLVTKVDRAVLAMACEAWADWVEATKTLREEGRYYETDKGFRGQHPAASRMTTARMAFVALSAKLGLSPVDRVRLAMPVEREKTLDEMLG
jgi:P27 family predicted phage terminase small subunit